MLFPSGFMNNADYVFMLDNGTIFPYPSKNLRPQERNRDPMKRSSE